MENTKPHKELAVSSFNLIPTSKNIHYQNLGISVDLSDRLSKLSLNELQVIASFAERYLTIRIDKPVLEHLLLDAASKKEDSELMSIA